eukprot:CAMPEP_0118956526 /NCGR_PEP_ID=MMETSP1169-20130426/61627_1 /TAXON_ID=36882 /ORGANISM="Pyramimonas obovata, Strain CCMP722" /LENGTH=605 /DNA_ID=CAMNT_0006904561 /DNA_START=47 /DNA_END=1864 /DNA_ORIENTATION=+
MNMLSARTAYGNAPALVAKKTTKAAVRGRSSRLVTEANVKLVPVPQTTAQKIACMTYTQGYIAYVPQEITFLGKKTVVVGATPEVGSDVDVVVPINTVSAKHCELVASADSIQVKDLGSRNGTYVDGEKVEGVVTAMIGSNITLDGDKGVEYTVMLDAAAPLKTPDQAADEIAATFPASASEAQLDARLTDRSAWIANYRSKSKTVAPSSSEAELEDRMADRSAWIANYRAKSVAPSSSEAELEDRMADRSAWIANYRSKSGGKKLKVAINGFGRIGRNFVRCLESRGAACPMELVAVNDSGGVKQAAHLLKYDSILGTFDADINIVSEDTFTLNGRPIKVVSNRNPLDLPWKELGVDIVIESTGVFIDAEGAGKHLTAGAKRVVITAPGKGEIPTYVVGVNADDMTGKEDIVSNASCTTNGMACFVKVLDEKFGIVKGMMTTTHSYTGDQRLLDNSHRDARRARAAALNIVPTSTGAAKAVALALPNLKGKLNGIALRVPTPNVSVVDLVFQVERSCTAEEVNAALREAADGELNGILSVEDIPLVSADLKGTNVSSTVDAALTMVMGDDLVKVVAWYDNEWGYTQRVVDLTLMVCERGACFKA